MKSICIKMTNQNITKHLLEQLNELKLDDVYFSCKKFKIYYNIIIHFKGKNENLFFEETSKILATFIIDLFEEKIIQNLIKSEYFYFDTNEQKQIANITFEDLYNNEESVYSFDRRYNLIYNSCLEYLLSNNSLVLKGFITFRLKNYLETILEKVDKSINKFIF